MSQLGPGQVLERMRSSLGHVPINKFQGVVHQNFYTLKGGKFDTHFFLMVEHLTIYFSHLDTEEIQRVQSTEILGQLPQSRKSVFHPPPVEPKVNSGTITHSEGSWEARTHLLSDTDTLQTCIRQKEYPIYLFIFYIPDTLGTC
eukprot:TRINITY_DN18577_c0_g1_i3.p1 TRINITY_DN18577_c0_g1~~TRINITY_DN18577_c0_g1_i3.p1  ORF type:complete len:144 (+),score=10.12 TRINITY_DN18577_c0_g1_i3:269-700(+)